MTTGRPDISMISPWPGPPLSRLLRPCDRPIVLAGAGVSAGCGLPTGEGLGSWLRSQAFAAGVDFSALDSQGRGLHPGYVASAILDGAERARRTAVLRAVAAQIESAQAEARYSRVVRAIAATPVGVVLTLNYDELIEGAARERGRAAHTLELCDVPELINDHLQDPDGELRVVHLHGSIADPGSLILDHHSYMEQAGDGRVRELLAALVAHNNLCAIGTKFDEDYLSALMLSRRPSRPRHVIVCDVDLADRVRSDEAGLGAQRHRWLPCAYAAGEYQVLDDFCERLVSCDEPSEPPGPLVEVVAASFETAYAPRRFLARDEVDPDAALSPELQLQFSGMEAHGERVLEEEQLAVVIGPPGSGKTRLMQELACREGAERPLFLRLRDLDDLVGMPELLLRSWLQRAVAFEGEPVPVEDVLGGRVRAWLLLDGLDEVAPERRVATAEAVERLAQAFPQHRFTVTSRPVAALAELSAPWRVLDLVCDEEWRSSYLRANEVDAEWFWRVLGPPAPQLRSLLQTPFFLVAALRLLEAGERLGDAMQIALALLDMSLRADERLAALGPGARRWLTKVALLQQLSGTVSVEEDLLREVSETEGLGDPAALTDLLASRSLLVGSGGSWSFAHRLFGEALTAEYLLGEAPGHWLDSLAPEVDGWSAVLDHWAAPLRMTLAHSPEWRLALAARDPRFVARATPREAPAAERLEAATLLWRRAAEWEVWLDSNERNWTATDAEAIAGLLRAGGIESLEAEVRKSLGAASRFVRANAVEVLSAVPVADVGEILARVLDDDDVVVRRTAALAARRLELGELADAVGRWAISPEDETEADEMAAIAIALRPPERRLAFAKALLEAGNGVACERLALEELPAAERVEWLRLRVRAMGGTGLTLRRAVERLVADVGDEADGKLAEEIGYLVALSGSTQAAVLDFLASQPEAARGVVAVIEEEAISPWVMRRLLSAAGRDALEAARAPEEVLAAVEPEHQPALQPPPPQIDSGRATREDLASVLRLPLEERRGRLARRAHFDRVRADGLGPAAREALARTLDEWWGEADLGEAVRRSGGGTSIEDWAAAVLSFGPAIDLALGDARWTQAATCGWLFEPQREWLAAQASQDRLDRAAATAAEVRVLTDLAQIGIGFDLRSIRERLRAADLSGTDDSDLGRAGEAVLAAAGVEGLTSLAGADDRWHAALRPLLAAAGEIEAQLAELADLGRHLRAGEEVWRTDLDWLGSIGDPRALSSLGDVLVAAGESGLDTPTGIGLPVRRAIRSIGGAGAVELLDRIARERPYPGAQFLVDDREQALQSLLAPAAESAAQAAGETLRLPVTAASLPGRRPPLVRGELGQQLREALQGMAFAGLATAVGAQLRPASARAPGEAASSPAVVPVRVALGEMAAQVLGEGARARAMAGEGRVVLWLSGLTAVGVGASVLATAIGADGEPVSADAQLDKPAGTLQIELAWDAAQPPGEIAVTVVTPN